MLDKVQGAVGSKNSADLANSGDRVLDAAEGPGGEDGIRRPVANRKLLSIESYELDREACFGDATSGFS